MLERGRGWRDVGDAGDVGDAQERSFCIGFAGEKAADASLVLRSFGIERDAPDGAQDIGL